MNLFLPLALIKSPGYLTEQYHVFSDEIIIKFITENKVDIRDRRPEIMRMGPDWLSVDLWLRSLVVENDPD